MPLLAARSPSDNEPNHSPHIHQYGVQASLPDSGNGSNSDSSSVTTISPSVMQMMRNRARLHYRFPSSHAWSFDMSALEPAVEGEAVRTGLSALMPPPSSTSSSSVSAASPGLDGVPHDLPSDTIGASNAGDAATQSTFIHGPRR